MRGHSTQQLSFGDGFIDPSLYALDGELQQVDQCRSQRELLGLVSVFSGVPQIDPIDKHSSEREIPLNNPRLEEIVRLVGWIIFTLALLYVYLLPLFLSPQVFEQLSGVVEGLLVALVDTNVKVNLRVEKGLPERTFPRFNQMPETVFSYVKADDLIRR